MKSTVHINGKGWSPIPNASIRFGRSFLKYDINNLNFCSVGGYRTYYHVSFVRGRGSSGESMK